MKVLRDGYVRTKMQRVVMLPCISMIITPIWLLLPWSITIWFGFTSVHRNENFFWVAIWPFDSILLSFDKMTDMKINLPPILDWGIRLMGLFLILFLSVEIDKFAFGMMNAINSISFGMCVALFLGTNVTTFFLIYELYKSTINKHFKNN